MKRVIGYFLLGALAYGAFLIATFPAERAVALLAQQQPQLRAAGLTGSAWSGQAASVQIAGQTLERLRWQLKPWSVLLGSLALELRLDGSEIAGEARLDLRPDGAIEFSAVDLRLPAAAVSALIGLPLDLGGQFLLQLDSARLLNNRLMSAAGLVRWQRAAVTAPLAQPLGEFSAQLSNEADAIKAQIKDEGGPLQLDGVAQLKMDGSYSFNGNVAVRDKQQNLLVQGVNSLGRPGADGRVPLRYNGRL